MKVEGREKRGQEVTRERGEAGLIRRLLSPPNKAE